MRRGRTAGGASSASRCRALARAAARLCTAVLIGLAATLLSTFVGERWATAVYPEIMGCEAGCRVVATGWPFVFVRDYPGMSVVNTADILEVVLAADRFDRRPFLADLIFWTAPWLFVRSRLRRPGTALSDRLQRKGRPVARTAFSSPLEANGDVSERDRDGPD